MLHATTLRIPIVEVEGGSLTALAGFDGHQGVAVVVEARRFASLDEILARAIERSEPPFILVLDSLEDPQNVGTLLRSAEAVGVHGVIFPTERQSPLSPAAIKASAGATEHLLLAPVDDLAGALTDLHLRGLRVVGSDADAGMTAREADLRGPIALVVGSEGHGLSPGIRRRCDLFVRIPMRGSIGSLNAAVAGSVLLFEVLGQQGTLTTAPKEGGTHAAPVTSSAASAISTATHAKPPRKGRPASAASDASAAAPMESTSEQPVADESGPPVDAVLEPLEAEPAATEPAETEETDLLPEPANPPPTRRTSRAKPPAVTAKTTGAQATAAKTAAVKATAAKTTAAKATAAKTTAAKATAAKTSLAKTPAGKTSAAKTSAAKAPAAKATAAKAPVAKASGAKTPRA